MQETIASLMRQGAGSTRLRVLQKALDRMAEDAAVEEVLTAEKEVSQGKLLRGDPRKIVQKLK